MARFILLLLLLSAMTPAFAVMPDEKLPDPILESRARTISKQLRCVVCQNETIDESNATIARDIRGLVRQSLSQGDDDQAVIQAVVARYGEFVLLKPQWSGQNMILWLSPFVVLMAGFAGLWFKHKK